MKTKKAMEAVNDGNCQRTTTRETVWVLQTQLDGGSRVKLPCKLQPRMQEANTDTYSPPTAMREKTLTVCGQRS